MCRQEIRSILRTNIDVEHPELATAANRPVQKPRSRCSRQQFPGVFVPIMPVPFYESEDETGLTSDDNMEDTRENLITFGSPRHNQLTTVIEFAQSLAGQRLFERELQNMRSLDPQEEEEERPSKADKDDDEEEEEDEDDDDDSPESASSDSDEEKPTTETKGDGKRIRASAKELSVTLPRISFFKKGKVCKEAEEKEKTEDVKPSNGESATTSGSTMPQSDPIPVTSTPVMPIKSNKKREKFDSGVGDEIENGKGPSSEDSDQGDEGDVEMEVDSTDSDFSDGSSSRPTRLRNRTRNKVTRLLDPDDPDCPCGGDCSKSWKDKKDEETKEEGDGQNSASPPAESYSTYMREKIGLLPLPQALKLYLNYYREL